MATQLGKSITGNWMTGTEQKSYISLPTTEIVGSVKNSIGVVDPFMTDTEESD